MFTKIIGTGSYLPEQIRSNADLEKMVETTDEWIVTRTGIRERRIAAPEETVATMGFTAAQRALDFYLKENMSTPTPDGTFFAIKPGISQEEALVHASDLLRSAAATAYESASSHQGNQRDLAFSVVYLIDMAKAIVERSLQAPDAQASA